MLPACSNEVHCLLLRAQAHLGAPLLAGARRLLAVLLGSRGGLALLLGARGAAAALLAALDPGACDPVGNPALAPNAPPPPRGSAAEAAATLRAALAAAQAAAALGRGGCGDAAAAAAVDELAGSLGCEQGRRAVVQALVLAPGALAALLDILAVRAASPHRTSRRDTAASWLPIPLNRTVFRLRSLQT